MQFRHKMTLNKSGMRKEILNGKHFSVIPGCIMTEGVHSGSDGAYLYPGSELEKWTPSWNHKPVVINHPIDNEGNPASASDAVVMQTTWVGFLMNTVYSGENKQDTEVWLDDDILGKVRPDVAVRLANGETIEVSTGVIADKVAEAGVFNGKAYVGIAVNHRPDHLALLPDSVGACSVKDGCGCGGRIANEDKPKKKKLTNKAMGKHIENMDLSFDEVGRQVQDQLRTRFGRPGVSWYGMVHAIYDDKVIYETDEPPYSMMMLPYTVNNGKVTLSKDDPTACQRIVSYKMTSNEGFVADADGILTPILSNSEGRMSFKRDEVLTALIGNGKPFPEADRKTVESFSDDTLKGLHESFVTNKKVDKKEEPPVVEKKPDGKIATLDELLANASPVLREGINELLDSQLAEKQRLIDVIANATKAEPDSLKGIPIKTLKVLAAPHEKAAGRKDVTDINDLLNRDFTGAGAFQNMIANIGVTDDIKPLPEADVYDGLRKN